MSDYPAISDYGVIGDSRTTALGVQEQLHRLVLPANLRQPLALRTAARQGAASLMSAMGIPTRVAMELPGHLQIATTMNIYAHVAPEYGKEAMERMGKALWGGD